MIKKPIVIAFILLMTVAFCRGQNVYPPNGKSKRPIMKHLVLVIAAIWWFGLSPVYCQDPNILIGLASPAYGVTIQANFPNGPGGWTRGFKISNQDNSQSFIMLGTFGSYTNGQSSETYSYIGRIYSNPYMTFLPTGNVGIGTINPKAKLAVNGNILAKEVKVKTDISVPDYVFEPDYELPSLAEVEAYVKEYKHLPEIPSAADIERDGLDLAEMNLLLLKKVEELTLHLIDLNRTNELQNKEIAALKSIIKPK